MRMIFEGSCDTEYWTMAAKKIIFAITRINYTLKYNEIENSYFKW